MFGKSVLLAAKNYTKSYLDVQALVHEATSNDPQAPPSTQLMKFMIVGMTFKVSAFPFSSTMGLASTAVNKMTT
jgi:hypothetical protein